VADQADPDEGRGTKESAGGRVRTNKGTGTEWDIPWHIAKDFGLTEGEQPPCLAT